MEHKIYEYPPMIDPHKEGWKDELRGRFQAEPDEFIIEIAGTPTIKMSKKEFIEGIIKVIEEQVKEGTL